MHTTPSLIKEKGYKMSKDYTKIRVHMVYDVKHDGGHKARLVAGDHLTKIPFDWYSKKQGTVDTAPYGSEFVAARIALEQIIANKPSLQYLGVKVLRKVYLFGDNRSVVDSSSIPHTALSFHRVREMIASDNLSFNFIPGTINLADILSKHWGCQQIWSMLKIVLFREGDPLQTL